MLVRPDDGAVDHGIFVVSLASQALENPFPHPGFRPATEPSVGVFPVTESFRQITPGNSRTVAIEHRFDESAIVLGSDTDMAGSPWQQVLDALPLVIAQSVPGHGVSLFQS